MFRPGDFLNFKIKVKNFNERKMYGGFFHVIVVDVAFTERNSDRILFPL